MLAESAIVYQTLVSGCGGSHVLIRRYRRYLRLIDRTLRVWFHALEEIIMKPGDRSTHPVTLRSGLIVVAAMMVLVLSSMSARRVERAVSGASVVGVRSAITIPVAVTVFPGEQYQGPRSWTERAHPKLIYYHHVEKGGHFAAWEQPTIFSQELRAAFKSFR
jgi:hypothetical protein